MEKRDLFSIALKVTGLYCWIQAIEQLGPAIQSFSGILLSGIPMQGFPVIQLLFGHPLALVLYLALGLHLIKRSERIAQKCFPLTGDVGVQPHGLSMHEACHVAYMVLGVFLLATSIPDLVRFIPATYGMTSAFTNSRALDFSAAGPNQTFAIHAVSVLQIMLKGGIGLFLFLGSQIVVDLQERLQWRRVRD